MKLVNPPSTQPQIEPLLRQELHTFQSRRKRLMVPILVAAAMMICAWPAARTFAADLPDNERSVQGTMVPSSGSTADPGISPTKRTSIPSSASADPLSRAAQPDERCAILRKKYAKSEACFARYRMKNHGLRAGAFQRCKQMNDPSSDCGPPVIP
jgi:hypothetical protein